jgi:hypothetical protein
MQVWACAHQIAVFQTLDIEPASKGLVGLAWFERETALPSIQPGKERHASHLMLRRAGNAGNYE